MKLVIGKLFIIAGLMCSVNTNSQILNSKFDTKNHPKAKGVWLTIRYPSGWDISEGERPNIVQRFIGSYKEIKTTLLLQILDTGAPVEDECSMSSAEEMAEAFSDTKSNQLALNVKKIRHENKPAFIYDFQSQIQRAGSSFKATHRVMTVCYKNTLITAWCSPVKMDSFNKQIESNIYVLNEVAPLCFKYFNSLVLMDNYVSK